MDLFEMVGYMEEAGRGGIPRRLISNNNKDANPQV
jgi:hypothetical protein